MISTRTKDSTTKISTAYYFSDLTWKYKVRTMGAHAGRPIGKLVAARTAQNFDDDHVGAGWLKQDSRQRTRERVVLDALFLFLPPSHHLWSCVYLSFLIHLRGC